MIADQPRLSRFTISVAIQPNSRSQAVLAAWKQRSILRSEVNSMETVWSGFRLGGARRLHWRQRSTPRLASDIDRQDPIADLFVQPPDS